MSISKLFQELDLLESNNLQVKLMNIKTIQIAKNYIKENNINIEPKILLSSLLLKSEPKICSDELFLISNEIVQSVINNQECNELIKDYNDKFIIWSEEDKKQNQKTIQKVKSQVSQIMKQAFWDKIYDDLSNKKNDSVEVLLIDLREKTKGLCINEDMKNQIDKQFDIEIIKQIIDNDEMNEKDFEMFFQPMYQIIKNLQSSKNDEILNTAYLKVKTQLEKNDWKIAFVSSIKILTEAVSEIYIDLINLTI